MNRKTYDYYMFRYRDAINGIRLMREMGMRPDIVARQFAQAWLYRNRLLRIWRLKAQRRAYLSHPGVEPTDLARPRKMQFRAFVNLPTGDDVYTKFLEDLRKEIAMRTGVAVAETDYSEVEARILAQMAEPKE